ncbi:hypothetical protein DM02DRAFT_613334 [Periconia macrospinosa]|uniref:Uncharacterized protein n=1 Tax=Periconia macrospinosa TaxID=97972 RepID=A0A2V1DUL1_9PLEO|nr:hypothetical protein DM02DRAFT_613334 [Periconia macrospinosa]
MSATEEDVPEATHICVSVLVGGWLRLLGLCAGRMGMVGVKAVLLYSCSRKVWEGGFRYTTAFVARVARLMGEVGIQSSKSYREH